MSQLPTYLKRTEQPKRRRQQSISPGPAREQVRQAVGSVAQQHSQHVTATVQGTSMDTNNVQPAHNSVSPNSRSLFAESAHRRGVGTMQVKGNQRIVALDDQDVLYPDVTAVRPQGPRPVMPRAVVPTRQALSELPKDDR